MSSGALVRMCSCATLLRRSKCCNMLQHTATHCFSTLPRSCCATPLRRRSHTHAWTCRVMLVHVSCHTYRRVTTHTSMIQAQHAMLMLPKTSCAFSLLAPLLWFFPAFLFVLTTWGWEAAREALRHSNTLNTLQNAATHCDRWKKTAIELGYATEASIKEIEKAVRVEVDAVCCSVLQCAAV